MIFNNTTLAHTLFLNKNNNIMITLINIINFGINATYMNVTSSILYNCKYLK